jgi:hypothetical protein
MAAPPPPRYHLDSTTQMVLWHSDWFRVADFIPWLTSVMTEPIEIQERRRELVERLADMKLDKEIGTQIHPMGTWVVCMGRSTYQRRYMKLVSALESRATGGGPGFDGRGAAVNSGADLNSYVVLAIREGARSILTSIQNGDQVWDQPESDALLGWG